MSIIPLFTSVIKLVGVIVTDKILAKWLAEIKFWISKQAEPALRAQVDAEYKKLETDFEGQKNHDKPIP